MANSVKPEELEEYEALVTGLRTELSPDGPVEESIAAEIIRSAWRLRRCAAIESELSLRTDLDPMLDEKTASAQADVDNARAEAHSAMHAAIAELRTLRGGALLPQKKIQRLNGPESTLVH